MSKNSDHQPAASPILLVPYMWIGDFVRCHSVVKVLRARFPERPVDVLSTTLCAPLADYMPGVRKAIVFDLPRRRLALAAQKQLAGRLRAEHYGSALIMPRTWKSVLAPFLAGIPERTGFVGEARFGLLNDLRWASASCRAWSTSAERSLCRTARRFPPTGRCRTSTCRSRPRRNGARNAD